MIVLLVLSHDGFVVKEFYQSADPLKVRARLQELTIEALGGEEEILSEDTCIDKTPDEIRAMSFKELAKFTGWYAWGDDNRKTVHVLDLAGLPTGKALLRGELTGKALIRAII